MQSEADSINAKMRQRYASTSVFHLKTRIEFWDIPNIYDLSESSYYRIRFQIVVKTLLNHNFTWHKQMWVWQNHLNSNKNSISTTRISAVNRVQRDHQFCSRPRPICLDLKILSRLRQIPNPEMQMHSPSMSVPVSLWYTSPLILGGGCMEGGGLMDYSMS